MRYQYPEERYLLVGKVKKPHGMSGEVSVHCFSGDVDRFCDFSRIRLVDPGGRLSIPLAVESCRVHGRASVLVRLSEIGSRLEAEDISGAGVLVEKSELPPLEESEYYWYQLQDKTVVDEAGNILGKVKAIFNNGGHDVLVVRDETEADELLIPVVEGILVDFGGETIVVNLPPGLIELNHGEE